VIMRSSLGKLIEDRLRGGYDEFGSAIFEWDLDRYHDEAMEELADLIIYSCFSFAKVSDEVERELESAKPSEDRVDWS